MDETFICGDYEYELRSDGTAEIIRYHGDRDVIHLTFPAELDGHPVTAFSSHLGADVPMVERLTLPESITLLRYFAFSDWNRLVTLDIPNSLTSFNPISLRNAPKLCDLRVADSHPTLKVVRGLLFDKTSHTLLCCPPALHRQSCTVPKGTLVIGKSAFEYCKDLTTVVLPDGLTTIEQGAFVACTGLRSVNLPDSITSIGVYAF